MMQGADIEYRDEARCTPLHHAVFSGSVDTVRWILKAGADVNAVNDWFGTPLCLAAVKGNLAVTQLLLVEHKANVKQECWYLGSAAHAACASGNIDVVKALHAAGASLDVKRKTCLNALRHLAQLSWNEVPLMTYYRLLVSQACQNQSPRDIAVKLRHSGVVDFCSGLEILPQANGTWQPTISPIAVAPRTGRTLAIDKPQASVHSQNGPGSTAIPTGYPSQPPWTHSTALGGQFYYNPRTDEIVMKSGQHFPRPRQMPARCLVSSAWDFPQLNSPLGSSRPPLLSGGREQMGPKSRPRSTDSAAGMQAQDLTRQMNRTAPPSRKVQEKGDRRTVISGDLDSYEPVQLDEKIRRGQFFTYGRVFVASWSEHADKRLPPKIGTFVVIREGIDRCEVLTIDTYGGQGVAQRGVKKSEHAIIHTGRTTPRARHNELPKAGETGMQPIPIRVNPDNPTDKLDPMSRIHFVGITTVEHNVKVKALGFVNPTSIGALNTQFREVCNAPARDDRQGNEEEEDDDEEDEEDEDEDEDEDDEDEDDEDDDELEELGRADKQKVLPHRSASQTVDQSSKHPVILNGAGKKLAV
jgi:hypothetical protein